MVETGMAQRGGGVGGGATPPWACPMVGKISKKKTVLIGKSQRNLEKVRRILRKFRRQFEIFV